jgi:hypothetical protein
MEHNIRKHKELLETRKRVNEFKLKHMKILNEQIGVQEEEGERLVSENNNDPMIKTEHGMQTRFHAR